MAEREKWVYRSPWTWRNRRRIGAAVLGLAVLMASTRCERLGADAYLEVRQQVEHEDNLLNHRLTWLMTSQSFLFAVYAIQYAAPTGGPAAYLFQVIPVVGIVCAGLIYLSVVAAVGALENLRLSFEDKPNAPLHPPLVSPGWTLVSGLVAPIGMPILLVYVWTALIQRA